MDGINRGNKKGLLCFIKYGVVLVGKTVKKKVF